MAHAWDLPHFDDPRQLLVNHPTSFWLISSMKRLTLDDLALAVDQGATVLSLEPFVEQMSDPGELTSKLAWAQPSICVGALFYYERQRARLPPIT